MTSHADTHPSSSSTVDLTDLADWVQLSLEALNLHRRGAKVRRVLASSVRVAFDAGLQSGHPPIDVGRTIVASSLEACDDHVEARRWLDTIVRTLFHAAVRRGLSPSDVVVGASEACAAHGAGRSEELIDTVNSAAAEALRRSSVVLGDRPGADEDIAEQPRPDSATPAPS